MALSVIRQLTSLDQKRLNDSAERFANRHGINLQDPYLQHETSSVKCLEFFIWSTYPEQGIKLKKLWQACRCRALGVEVSSKIQIAYGYVGYSVS